MRAQRDLGTLDEVLEARDPTSEGGHELPLLLRHRPLHVRRPPGASALHAVGRRGSWRRVGAGAGVVAMLVAAGICVAVVSPSLQDPATPPPEVTVRPVVPPAGGFAVAADRMDDTLVELLGAVSNDPVRILKEQQTVLVEVLPSGVRRAVQTGAVLVGAIPYLVEVAVRRAPDPTCASSRCEDVVDHPGSDTAPHSIEAVVDADGVEVAVRVWNGPRRDAPATLEDVPLSTRNLLSLAADDRWRR